MLKLMAGMAAGLSLALVAAPAAAAVVFSLPGPSQAYEISHLQTFEFNASAGAGTIDFKLLGRGTVDGNNATCPGVGDCVDFFFLGLNNNGDILQGWFVMGGVGDSGLQLIPVGGTTTTVSNGFGQGGYTLASLPVMLVDGVNTLTFGYLGTPEGIDSEAWQIADLVVTGNPAVGGVPEPATWALMIGGFGLAGAMLRRRTAVVRG